MKSKLHLRPHLDKGQNIDTTDYGRHALGMIDFDCITTDMFMSTTATVALSIEAPQRTNAQSQVESPWTTGRKSLCRDALLFNTIWFKIPRVSPRTWSNIQMTTAPGIKSHQGLTQGRSWAGSQQGSGEDENGIYYNFRAVRKGCVEKHRWRLTYCIVQYICYEWIFIISDSKYKLSQMNLFREDLTHTIKAI